MFKSQLQEYAHRAGWTAPVYDVIREGPSHEPRYKAIVTVGNETFECPGLCSNLKKAEHAAAEAALLAFSARPESQLALQGPLQQSGLCKNLLQEFAQKSKLPVPVYTLIKSGPTHAPMFTATVKIDGVLYKGGLSRNKKEAEIKAAKTTLLAICAERGGTPEQAFSNQLDLLGKEARPLEVTSRPPSTRVTRKRNRHRRGIRRCGAQFQVGERRSWRPVKRGDASQQGYFDPEHYAGPMVSTHVLETPWLASQHNEKSVF